MMRISCAFILSLSLLLGSEAVEPILLDGNHLTIEQVHLIAIENYPIEIDPIALKKVSQSHQLLLLGGKKGLPIYGLNRGVGLNKDRQIFKGDAIDPEVKELSEKFNRNMIYSHSTGIGSDMPEEIVRATMAIRLNMLLKGVSGIQPEAVMLLADFLNRGIHPAMPFRGSVGEADIAILSHIALAMIGEGEVTFMHQRMAASDAFKATGLKPFKPFAKDALSILSSNAFSVGYGSLNLHQAKALLNHMNLVFTLSLEGLNGNIAPLTLATQKEKPFCSQWIMAEHARNALQGSYLWDLHDDRALQDPLSFRSASQTHGAVLDMLSILERQMTINLNHSDDNPSVLVGMNQECLSTPQESSYYVEEGALKGAIVPSDNFEPVTWVIKFEALNIALAHASHNAAQRMVHLSDPHLTHLPRFLSGTDTAIAFGTIQKAFSALDSENRSLANPVSMDSLPLAGAIEDHATNAPLVIDRFAKIMDNLIYIAAIEEMHAAQAISLRLHQNPDLKLGVQTEKEYLEFRKSVPILCEDRVLQKDIEKAAEHVRKTIQKRS